MSNPGDPHERRGVLHDVENQSTARIVERQGSLRPRNDGTLIDHHREAETAANLDIDGVSQTAAQHANDEDNVNSLAVGTDAIVGEEMISIRETVQDPEVAVQTVTQVGEGHIGIAKSTSVMAKTCEGVDVDLHVDVDHDESLTDNDDDPGLGRLILHDGVIYITISIGGRGGCGRRPGDDIENEDGETNVGKDRIDHDGTEAVPIMERMGHTQATAEHNGGGDLGNAGTNGSGTGENQHTHAVPDEDHSSSAKQTHAQGQDEGDQTITTLVKSTKKVLVSEGIEEEGIDEEGIDEDVTAAHPDSSDADRDFAHRHTPEVNVLRGITINVRFGDTRMQTDENTREHAHIGDVESIERKATPRNEDGLQQMSFDPTPENGVIHNMVGNADGTILTSNIIVAKSGMHNSVGQCAVDIIKGSSTKDGKKATAKQLFFPSYTFTIHTQQAPF